MTINLKPGQKLFVISLLSVIFAALLWTGLFYKDEHISPVLTDIHVIYLSTLTSYFFIRLGVKAYLFDFIKILARILFRVWLLIFITLVIVKSMDRVGLLLSITFLFGYFEGCMDIDKWVQQYHPFKKLFSIHVEHNNPNEGMMTLFFMSIVHIFCAAVAFVFSRFLM